MKNMGILHIAQDEKFINSAIYQFNRAFPGENRFVITRPPANPPMKYIDSTHEIVIEVLSENTPEKLLQMTREYDVVVFHGVNGLKGWLLLNSDQKHKFMGIIYGAEIFNKDVAGKNYLGEKTRKLEASLQKTTVMDVVKNIYRKIRYKGVLKRFSNIDMRKVIPEFRVLGTLPGYSRKGFKYKELFNDSVKKVPFTYYPLEYIIKDRELRADGPDILLGNSASATNNHLEAFDFLSGLNLEGKKIYTPLSYGMPDYADAVEEYGSNVLGDRFAPLTTFLPLQEYNKIISRCGVVIMNHYRSQAMGNLIASLYMGAKVYLNDTTAYQYFKNMGCHIFLIEKDLLKRDRALGLLSHEKAEHNRRVLEDEFSIDILQKKLKKSFEEIFNYTFDRKVTETNN